MDALTGCGAESESDRFETPLISSASPRRGSSELLRGANEREDFLDRLSGAASESPSSVIVNNGNRGDDESGGSGRNGAESEGEKSVPPPSVSPLEILEKEDEFPNRMPLQRSSGSSIRPRRSVDALLEMLDDAKTTTRLSEESCTTAKTVVNDARQRNNQYLTRDYMEGDSPKELVNLEKTRIIEVNRQSMETVAATKKSDITNGVTNGLGDVTASKKTTAKEVNIPVTISFVDHHSQNDVHQQKLHHHPLSVDEIIEEVSFRNESPRENLAFPASSSASPNASFLSTHDNTVDGSFLSAHNIAGNGGEIKLELTPSGSSPIKESTLHEGEGKNIRNLTVGTDHRSFLGRVSPSLASPEQHQPLTPNFPLDTDHLPEGGPAVIIDK